MATVMELRAEREELWIALRQDGLTDEGQAAFKERVNEITREITAMCPGGCGGTVELFYEHERDDPPHCQDCFEVITTGGWG